MEKVWSQINILYNTTISGEAQHIIISWGMKKTHSAAAAGLHRFSHPHHHLHCIYFFFGADLSFFWSSWDFFGGVWPFFWSLGGVWPFWSFGGVWLFFWSLGGVWPFFGGLPVGLAADVEGPAPADLESPVDADVEGPAPADLESPVAAEDDGLVPAACSLDGEGLARPLPRSQSSGLV
jgi:hypothetical protein